MEDTQQPRSAQEFPELLIGTCTGQQFSVALRVLLGMTFN
jgi:hypothetical protein